MYAKDILAWLEKQGQTFTKKDVDDAYLKGVCDTKHELEKQGEQKPVDLVAILKDYFANTPKEQREKDWAELKHLNDVGFDVEIPFGAKDSELVEATYIIPKGFHAEIIGDEVHIKQGEQKPHEDIVDEINRKAFPNHYGGCAPVLEIKQTKICKMVGPDDPEHLADFNDLLPNIFIDMKICIEGKMYRVKDIRTIIGGDLCRQIIEVE